MRTNRHFGVGVGLVAALTAMTAFDDAKASTTDFEGFATGVSVNYQGTGGTRTYASVPPGNTYTVPDPYGSLWTVADEWGLGRIATPSTTDNFDERVVLDGGNKVLRYSNAVTSGGFSDLPNSPSSPEVAGETTAFLWNDRGLNHTMPVITQRAASAIEYFHGGFRFKSATGAAQAGLALSVSPAARQSDRRNSFVGLVDSGTGLNVTFADSGIGGTFPPTITIATGLSYSDWHTVDIYVKFVDGLNVDGSGNDVVTVQVNGVTAHVGTTWETFYRVATPTRPVGAVDALFFASRGTAAPLNSGNGFFFDDVVVDHEQVTLSVLIDVLKDSINTSAKQQVKIALLGSATFDPVFDVDHELVRARSAMPIASATKVEDINTDGYDDVVFKFRATEFDKPTPEECLANPSSLLLTGELNTAQPFAGSDTVTYVGPDCK